MKNYATPASGQRTDFHYTCPKCGMNESAVTFAHVGETICYRQACPGRKRAREREGATVR